MNTTDIKVGCIRVNYRISEASGSGSVGLSLQDMCRNVEKVNEATKENLVIHDPIVHRLIFYKFQ